MSSMTKPRTRCQEVTKPRNGMSRGNCIAGYALLWVNHRIRSDIYFGTPTGIRNGQVWLTVGVWLIIQSWEHPPLYFCGNPPPPWYLIGYGMVIRQSDRIAYLPGRVFWEATKWLVLPGFGLAFAIVNKRSRIRNHHHFNHLLSPPQSSSTRNLNTCSVPEWK